MLKTTFQPRYQKVADTLRKRIVSGDYTLKPIPSERSLAQELGVHAMTARQGLQMLVDEGLLVRQSNGRAGIKKIRHGVKKHLNLAFLAPTLVSPWIEGWRLAIEKVADRLQCNVRTVVYMHWDDPLLLDALNGFDGIFLDPSPEPIPASVRERIGSNKHPVVVVDQDFSALGFPSIQLFPPGFMQKLLDHLESLGHRNIGCLNTQPDNPVVAGRINVWRCWMETHNFAGRLISEPVAPYGSTMQQGYEVMSRLLSEEKRRETAWFCVTIGSAIGAMKAMLDRGLEPGRDIAICVANGEGIASYFNPPITELQAADPSPFISYSVRWMMQGGQNWQGPLLMQPAEVPLVIGASTDPKMAANTPTPKA